MKEVELFVPGRVGLIGELSDLVSPYLDINKKLVPGKCLACRIDRGIYSKCKKSNNIVYKYDDLEFSCNLNEEELIKEINKNGYYSYLCGTILYMLREYHVGGININITKMDLPIKNGLSSSASFCLTVVKAYNELYNLNLTKEDVIYIAHQGEILAGSRCGNLDYESIMNDGLILLTFYKDKTKIEKVIVKENIYFLIVNLNSCKNTKDIMNVFNDTLSNSNSCNESILNIVNSTNEKLVYEAKKYLDNGNVKDFANCLNKAQELMDNASDVCKEFIAPKLHLIMNDDLVKNLSFGIKSIGSGGDGSALIVCKNNNDRCKLKKYLLEKYEMDSIDFNLWTS